MEPRTLARVSRRILVLLRSRLAAGQGGSGFPAAPLLMLSFVSTAVCLIVRDATGPFGFALVVLSAAAALIAVPLLGDLSALLTADETGDWVRALPVRASEIHIARALHLLIALFVLTSGALAPALVLAPAEFDLAARATLFAAGQAQSVLLAGALLAAQSLLRGRAHALLVALQSALLVLTMVGTVAGLELVPQMRSWSGPDAAPALRYIPSTWFASFFAEDASAPTLRAIGLAASALALAAVLFVPAPSAAQANAGSTLVGALLAPLRRLLARTWVRGRERATFEWVFDALPKEREFVLRAYPLLAVPLGFLLLGGGEQSGDTRRDLLALLLFIPGAYAPLMVAHTPGTSSHRARWILDTAPVELGEIENGAFKAVAARFLAPLYLVLVVLGGLQGRLEFTLQLAGPAFLTCLIATRAVWRTCVVDLPLSTPHEKLYINNDWMGVLAVVAFALLGLAIAGARFASWPVSFGALIVLALFEHLLDRRMAAGRAHAGA